MRSGLGPLDNAPPGNSPHADGAECNRDRRGYLLGRILWRVHEPSPDKCQGYDGYDRQPKARAPPQSRNADDDHEWSRRQKVTRQQRAPQDSHGHHINGDYGEKRILHFQADPRPLDSVLFQWRAPHREQCSQREQRKTQISEGLPEAYQQSQQDSQRMQRGLHVVAEKFRIAEDISRAEIVKSVPCAEWDKRNKKQKLVFSAPAPSLGRLRQTKPRAAAAFPRKQRKRSQNCSLLGQSCAGKPKRRCSATVFHVCMESPKNQARRGEVHMS